VSAVPPPIDAARTADRIGALLGTRDDVLLLGGEAMLALEAAATSLAAPGRRAVNVVTSPYGAWFGVWLERGGAEVVTVRPADPHRAADADEVAAAIRAHRPAIVALVHGEASSGIVNPVERIAAASHEAGAIVVVDAVASLGGHELDASAWGLDVVAMGPQKALDGPVSLSALSVSPAAWELVAAPTPEAPSALSLADLRRDWLDTGRGALPGTPDPVVFAAMSSALDAVEAEGLAARIARHAAAAARARDAVRAAGLSPWVPVDAEASHLVTTVAVPDGVDVDALLVAATALDAGISAGVGEAGRRFVRINHTGLRATPAAVDASVAALADAARRLR
jgi:aspartate aminotransferase-like enzyme